MSKHQQNHDDDKIVQGYSLERRQHIRLRQDAASADTNASQLLRSIVRQHYERVDAEAPKAKKR